MPSSSARPAGSPALHRSLAGRPYAAMVEVSARLAERVSSRIGRRLPPDALLVDAPPAEREVEFRLQVRERPPRGVAGTATRWRSLEDVSPVVRSLAHEQFDDLVKRVRIFAAPEMAEAVAGCDGLESLVLESAAG